MFLEKSSVFKQFSHRKIPVRLPDRDRPDIYFDKVEFTLSFDQKIESRQKAALREWIFGYCFRDNRKTDSLPAATSSTGRV